MTEGFKRSVYLNEYKVVPEQRYGANDNIRRLIHPSWLGINRLFILAYFNDVYSTANLHRKYFLPRVGIENYSIELDGRNFYDQPIKQFDEVRKISTGHGDDYTTGCLLDFIYFKNSYRLIAADLSKQKALDADSRAIQQIFLLVKQVRQQQFTAFTKNQKKYYYNFLKEQ